MPYHINDEGNVGECDAAIRCPFGNFETEHYTTFDEAQRAYEAAMRGETFKPGLTVSPPPTATVRKLGKKAEKKRKKVAEHLAKLQPLPYVNQGYYTSGAPLHYAYPGMSFGAGRVTSVQQEGTVKTVEVLYPNGTDPNGDGTSERYSFEMKNDGIPAGDIWVNQASPEEAAVRELAARERNLETSLAFVCSDVKRRLVLTPYETRYTSDGGGKVKFTWSPRNELAKSIRGYKAMVEDAKTAGVANPHVFALNRYKDSIPYVSPSYEDYRTWPNAQPAFSRFVVDLLEQNPAPLSLVRTAWLEDGFDEGERPWLDYTFEDIGSRSD